MKVDRCLEFTALYALQRSMRIHAEWAVAKTFGMSAIPPATTEVLGCHGAHTAHPTVVFRPVRSAYSYTCRTMIRREEGRWKQVLYRQAWILTVSFMNVVSMEHTAIY